MTNTFTYERSEEHLVRIRLCGELSAETLAEFETEARVQLSLVKRERFSVCIDLRQVSDFTIEARDILERAQRIMARKAARTIYIADGSRASGLALRDMHR